MAWLGYWHRGNLGLVDGVKRLDRSMLRLAPAPNKGGRALSPFFGPLQKPKYESYRTTFFF